MNRLTGIGVASILLCALGAACGLGGDGELERVDSADLFGLDETTTSSTTSTTTTTTIPTMVTATSVVVDPTAGSTSTTIATESVELFFLDGSRLTRVSIELAQEPSASRVMAALEEGPPSGEVGIGLQSVVPRNLVNSVMESGEGFASVDLANGPFDSIDQVDQRLAIAQIVLTLTRRPGIGQVTFTVDGDPLAVPGRDNVQTQPGEAVSRQDYESLLSQVDAESPAPTTQEPTTTIDEPTRTQEPTTTINEAVETAETSTSIGPSSSTVAG